MDEFLEEVEKELKDIADFSCDPHVTEALQKLIRKIIGKQLENQGLF